MGFLAKLFGWGHRGRHGKVAHEPANQAYFTRSDIPSLPEPHSVVEDTKTPTVTGEIEYQLYVYDGRPLRGLGLRHGRTFSADIVRGHVRLTSTLTGGEWNSRSDDGFALSYGGRPFGASFNNKLRDYLDHVHARAVTVRYDGWYDKSAGIPNLKILAPSTRRSYAESTAARLTGMSPFDVPDDAHVIIFNAGKHSDAIERLLGRRSQCDAEVALDLIPTPKGSSAKPHIAVRTARDGLLLTEVTARQPIYKELLAMVGRKTKANIEKKESFVESDDDGFYYRVILAFS